MYGPTAGARSSGWWPEGLSAFVWAGPVSRAVSPLTSSFSQLFANLLPARRLAHLHDHRRSARPRPGALGPAWSTGSSSKPRRRSPFAQLHGAPARRAGLDLPLRHRLDGQGRALVGRALRRPARPGQAAAPCRRPCASSPPKLPYEDSLTLEQALAARRDARLRDGPRAALAPARRARPRGHPADVRLQGRQVAPAHRASSPTQPEGYWEGLGYDQNAWVGHSNGHG